jgi:hypothetical protein
MESGVWLQKTRAEATRLCWSVGKDEIWPFPLSRLTAIDPDEITAEAIGDWNYWVAQDYLF